MQWGLNVSNIDMFKSGYSEEGNHNFWMLTHSIDKYTLMHEDYFFDLAVKGRLAIFLHFVF